MIPLDQCEHGWVYRIFSRNLQVGVFDAKTKGFVGIREKFGNEYLFEELHRDTGPPFGTVSPEEKLEKCPLDDLRECGDTVCNVCGQGLTFDGKSTWVHASGSCNEARPVAHMNSALFKYLLSVEKRLGLRDDEEVP